MEDFLGILMFILFVGASLVGRMKKVQGPRPPFNPSAGPPVVEQEEESDQYEDPWRMPTQPQRQQPHPEIITVEVPAREEAKQRPSRKTRATDAKEQRFSELRSIFKTEHPIEVEDLSGDGAGGMVFGTQDLAQAVVMSEVLGKPRALRRRRH